MDQLSVTQAAALLGVLPQRVHQRIQDGSLPATRIGNQWVVDGSDVRRVGRLSSPGRPLSARSAWAILLVSADDHAASLLTPSTRSRARSRLRDLLGHPSISDLDAAPCLLARTLGGRARRVCFSASPLDLPGVRADPRVHASGVSLPSANLADLRVVEGHVREPDLDDLRYDHLLVPAPASRATVILHAVPPEAGVPASVDLGSVARSALALAADLAEHDGVRERNEAVLALSRAGAGSRAADDPESAR